MAKDARLPMRLPEALKLEFEWAAKKEGFRGASAWLRALGEERCEQLLAADGNERANNEPVLDAFVPGFGLDEED